MLTLAVGAFAIAVTYYHAHRILVLPERSVVGTGLRPFPEACRASVRDPELDLYDCIARPIE